MPLTKPHTSVAFRHNGRGVTLSRAGMLPVRGANSVEAVLAKHGVKGDVVVRHHLPGRLPVVTQHRVV